MTGATLLVTRTSVEQVPEQPAALPTLRDNVKGAPQADPALTVTVWDFVLPEIEALPLTDQE